MSDPATPPIAKPALVGKGRAGPGRPKGLRNRTTTILKDAILMAAEMAGGDKGIVGYLAAQAEASPSLFMPLLSKVLPLQGGEGETAAELTHRIERIIVRPQDSDR